MKKSFVTIGQFDGIHLGHQVIIGAVVKEARRCGGWGIVVTFDKLPEAVLSPETAPRLLTPPAEKTRLLKGLGVDKVLILHFTPEFAACSARRFLDETILPLNVGELIVGEDFRFGRGRKGDISYLTKYADRHGFAVRTVPLLTVGGVKAGSSRIRNLLAAGDIEAARAMLGRYPSYSGRVVPGDGRGREIGFPTANLMLDKNVCLPEEGVYAGVAVTGGARFVCLVNLGLAPTFGPRRAPLMEAHLLGYKGDLYGRVLEVEIRHRLRDELVFPDTEALLAQLAKDAQTAARVVRL